MEHVLELALLELEVLFLKGCLLTGLRRWLLLPSGRTSLQHEALVHVCNEIVIKMLSVVFFDLRASSLVVRDHGPRETHATRHVLTLIDHVTALKSLVIDTAGTHRLI